MSTMKNYFCIFAGGGVRGTAYTGAFKALDEMGINITGLAGSSVGSIFASFYAVGYRAQELEPLFLNLNYENFKDLFLPFGKDFGICKGDNLYNWVKDTLEQKFYGDVYQKGQNKPILFSDVDKDLVIIATDIIMQQPKIFSRYTTPDTEIAQAIRASSSIPGFFRPVWVGDNCFVDGDIIKNLPLWVIINDIIPKTSRILEFRLEGNHQKIENPSEYFNAVLNTSTNISTDFIINLYGDNDQFDFVKISAENIAVIDFSISQKEKELLVNVGYETTKNYFVNTLVIKKENLLALNKEILVRLQEIKTAFSWNKIRNIKENIGSLFIFLNKHKVFLHKKNYESIVHFSDKFFNNIQGGLIPFTEKISAKNELILLLDNIILNLQNEIKEIEAYLI